MWMMDSSFKEKVTELWRDAPSMIPTNEKLDVLLRELSTWGRSRSCNFRRKVDDLKQKLLHLQCQPATEQNLKEQTSVTTMINEVLEKEEAYWAQRARTQWVAHGDKNTRFFHVSVLHRRRKNKINGLQINGDQWCYDEKAIANCFVNHFHSQFSAVQSSPLPDYIISSLPKIHPSNDTLIHAIPEREEILSILNMMGLKKSPGPDGLPVEFFKSSWEVVGEEVTNFIQSFFRSKCMPPKLNHTHIVLIPKVSNPSIASDYRPISLCNVVYKIITKLIATRLRPVLDDLISPFQNAFVPGRQICDNTVMAQEIFNSLQKMSCFSGGFALKIDMAKAYDRVDWSFLSSMLRGYGFSDDTHDLIMGCITSSSFSVLVNGEPHGDFRPGRGLRQGCPLSPYLFILCSEALSRLVEYKENMGAFKGLRINRWAPVVSHLLFADDLFFFGNAEISNVLEVKMILQEYERWSGQSVNFSKSSIIFNPKLDPYMQQLLRNILEVKAMDCNDKYLGNKLMSPKCRISSYSDLIDKCCAKMSGWRSRLLSHAGRTTLIKSTLASIPVYHMSSYLLPKEVLNRMKKIQRQFWWGAAIDQRRIYYTAWDHMVNPKNYGGLGIRDLSLVNKALVAKLAWRFISNPEALWVKLLKARYLKGSSFWKARKTQGCSRSWAGMLEMRNVIASGCCMEIHGQSTVLVWEDPWVLHLPGFRVEGKREKRYLVQFVGELILDGRRWNEGLIRDIFLEHEANAILRNPINETGTRNRFIWTKSVDGEFSAKSVYKTILEEEPSSSNGAVNRNGDLNWKAFWKVNALAPRVSMFIWRVMHDSLPVNAATARRVPEVDPCCRICFEHNETVDHILMHCPVVKMIWFSSPLGLPDNFNELTFKSYISGLLERVDKDGFKMASYLAWSIWKERCNVIFKKSSIQIQLVIKKALSMFNEFEQHTSFQEGSLSGESEEITRNHNSWIPPKPNYLSICLDGAYKDGRMAGAIVMRDSNGRFMEGKTKVMDYGSPLEAEAMALAMCLEVIDLSHGGNFNIESDCQGLVRAVLGLEKGNWRIRHVVDRAKALIQSRAGAVTISFIPRHHNRAAHGLASFAMQSRDCNSWSQNDHPLCIAEVLHEETVPSES